MQFFIHYFLHLGFPVIIAYVFFKPNWIKAYLILLATMLVDLDHLFADPIFQADRCSIGFHYLHAFPVIPIYFLLLLFPKTPRIIGLGLVMHMCTDFIDCMFTYQNCPACQVGAPAYDLMHKVGDLLNI